MSELNRKKMGPILKFVVIYSIVMIIFTVTCMFLYQKTGKTFPELIEGLFINVSKTTGLVINLVYNSDKLNKQILNLTGVFFFTYIL